nr:uncharacterized protein LOC115267028 [Aedes albopictus]
MNTAVKPITPFFLSSIETRKVTSPPRIYLRSKSGHVSGPPVRRRSSVNFWCTKDLNSQLEKMWEVENLDVGKALTQVEQDVENHFLQTISRDTTGRFVVRLPFRESMDSLLDDSYDQALRRFLAMEKRFTRDQTLREEYVRFMDDYERLGHMEVGSRVAGPQYFLPHHAVHRPDSSTTKTRIVFDASSKGSGALSLNDVLHTGPTVQPPLLNHIVNFRLPQYVFTADAEKNVSPNMDPSR